MKAIILAAALAVLAMPALAEVKSATAQGFEVVQTYSVKASPAALYAALLQPAKWWSSVHTYSHDAANLSLDPRPGGCFCETLKGGGGVQHLMVVNVVPGAALRFKGALGPLQAEGVEGSLTFELAPDGAGTKLSVSYVVGGYLRQGSAMWAPAVDGVLAEQVARLKRFAETGSAEFKP